MEPIKLKTLKENEIKRLKEIDFRLKRYEDNAKELQEEFNETQSETRTPKDKSIIPNITRGTSF